MVLCAFTSGASCGSGECRSDCSGRAGQNVFIRCDRCRPGQAVYRCSGCYGKFASAIKKRLPELETHHSGKLHREPAIDALLDINWSELARSGACEHSALELVQPELFRWCGACPSCYNFTVGTVESMVPPTFAAAAPRIVSDEIIELDAPRLDAVTGIMAGTRPVSVRVLSVDEVLTREQELELMYRAADPPAHDQYAVMWQPHAAPPEHDRWLLVRSTGWSGRDGHVSDEPRALSLVNWNVLRGCCDGTGEHELGAALLDCVRLAASFHRRQRCGPDDTLAQSNKTPSNVMRGPTPHSCIRVNRVSGPFGHLVEGMSFEAARARVRFPARCLPACMAPPTSPPPTAPSLLRQVCDPLVTGAIPRLWVAAICVPLVTRGGAITAIVPFYVSVKGGLNARVVTPRHHAIPRLGWVGAGVRVTQALREHRLALPLLTLMRRFTCTTYNGALLLRALGELRPDLLASQTTTTRTLSNYERNLTSFSSPPSLGRSGTRSCSVLPYKKVCVHPTPCLHARAPPCPDMCKFTSVLCRAIGCSRTWRRRMSGIPQSCARCTPRTASA